VADTDTVLVAEAVVLEAVTEVVEETVVVTVPEQKYRHMEEECVAEPVDKEKKTVLDPAS
jgi:hypothetical protein